MRRDADPPRLRPAAQPPVPHRDVLAGLAGAVVFLAGVWLVVSPWVIEHPATAAGPDSAVTDIAAGLLLALLGGVRAVSPFAASWPGWVALILGAWLVVAPFALGYRGDDAGDARANDVVTGAVVLLAAVAGLYLGARWGGAGRRGQTAR
ncbi:hypothetical protein B1813_18695 [Saccharomonospora piscinae]|uniref:SPW repeat-containing integral membrane domain-containing protein n=1 Tax=Saccharomonospora piscinae TaxID=687388 RepID=A0A1V8ZY94_SACPI|nr:SPW repeat protein [Saccharomonospora piscinae]OQO89875.1 hypothetical protein B1813_18695 [Saccharomonospora piscinae]